jgi:cullin 3
MPGSGLDIMIDTDKVDVLSRLYRLYILVPKGLPTLKNALKESIARRGKVINDASSGPDASEVMEQVEDPKGKGKARAKLQVNSVTPATEWVQKVLELKDQFDNIWEKAFQQNHVVEVAINEVRLSFCCGDWRIRIFVKVDGYPFRHSSLLSIGMPSVQSSCHCSLIII